MTYTESYVTECGLSALRARGLVTSVIDYRCSVLGSIPGYYFCVFSGGKMTGEGRCIAIYSSCERLTIIS